MSCLLCTTLHITSSYIRVQRVPVSYPVHYTVHLWLSLATFSACRYLSLGQPRCRIGCGKSEDTITYIKLQGNGIKTTQTRCMQMVAFHTNV